MSAENPEPIFNLPLFPLHFVLFPQFPLQVHVFEDRYKVMMKECIDRNLPFGVCLIAEGNETGPGAVPHAVGCIARILAVNKLEEGAMDLLAVGERRFRLLEYTDSERPYLVGRVEMLNDGEWDEVEPEKPLRDLHRLFKKYLRLLAQCSGLEVPEVALPEDPTTLGFCIAAIAQLPAEEKQRLLETTDPQGRLKSEKRILRRQIKELEAIRANSERADATETAEATETPTLGVVIAERLDTSRAFWQRYIHEARN